ncbi:MAG: hypothetical protein ACP5KE_07165 [Candidatus Methanodesulfokora sp.]
MIYRAKFRVLEQYLFRGPGEFDPSTRGVYSAASSTLLPSPATVAGSLAVTHPYVDTESLNWVDAYLHVLGRDVRIRGPYLRRESLLVENRVHKTFLRLEDIKNYCLIVRDLFEKGKGEEAERKIKELVEKVKFKKVQFVGIGLRTRKDLGKVTDEEAGLIYLAEFIDYISDFNFATIEFDLISSNVATGRYVVKFGGEGRISLLEVEKAEGYAYQVPEKAKFLYVASSVLFKTGKDFVEQLKEEMRKMGVKDIKVYGRIGLLGAGYSEVKRRRKPIYQALLPGSVIILGEEVGNAMKIYEEGIGVGREIGFGTVLPIGGGEG